MMMRSTLYLIAGLLSLTPLMADDKPQSLEDFKSEHRVILYGIPAGDAATREELTTAIEENADAIAERDIMFIDANGETDLPHHTQLEADAQQALIEQYQLDAKKTTFLLIGKDGGLKERIDGPDLVYFFGKIDQMPMRQAEIKAEQEAFSKKVRMLNHRKEVSRWMRNRR